MSPTGGSPLTIWLTAWALVCTIGLATPAHAQQDLGHKILGTLGIDAAVQRDTGLYVADRLVYYHANEVFDRNGDEVPIGLNLDAVANALGVGLSLEVPGLHTFYNAAIGVPIAGVHANTAQPQASVDRYGFGDLFVQPLGLGWRLRRADVVTGYSFYAPTGQATLGGSGGVGRGYWTHQLSLGGTLFFDDRRSWRLSALGSYNLNQRKRNIDITRGDTIQVQGGIGGGVHPLVAVGVAGYALWQVTDDTGSDLPAVLRGARDRTWGLGPEVSVLLPPIRSRFTVRYTHDISVRSRPRGGLLSLEFTWAAWRKQAND